MPRTNTTILESGSTISPSKVFRQPMFINPNPTDAPDDVQTNKGLSQVQLTLIGMGLLSLAGLLAVIFSKVKTN